MINQKGMEMAIQIFIVLFVLLAVSMLVLNLVSEQFQTQSTEIDRFTRTQEVENRINQFIVQCNNYCTSTQATQRANYCMSSISLSDDLFSSFDDTRLAGIGLCTDRIYCPMVTDCQNLTMESCKNVLCTHWGNQGIDAETTNTLLKRHFNPGACYANLDAEQRSLHWFTRFAEEGSVNIADSSLCN